jgi:DNA-binding NtrC family response regulator
MNEADSAFLGASQVSTAHILAIDDDPSVRQMIVDYLSDNEMRVSALASGKQIAEVMARETIDLVVGDDEWWGDHHRVRNRPRSGSA